MNKKYNTVFMIALTIFMLSGISHGYEAGSIEIHGFISQGYLQTDNNNFIADTKKGTFQFNEFGINFGTALTEELHVGLQLKATDLGDLRNDEVVLDWAFGDYKYADWLGIRAGKIKTPIGLYTETRDADMLRTCIILPSSFYIEYMKTFFASIQGAGIYGNIDAGPAGAFSYQFQMGTMNTGKEDGFVKILETYGVTDVTAVDIEDVYVSDIRWETPLDGLLIGWSYEQVEVQMPFAEDLMTFALSNINFNVFYLEYILNNFKLSSEFCSARLHTSVTMNANGAVLDQDFVQTDTYHVMALYRINDWLEVGTYYSMIYPDKDDKDGDAMEAKHSAWLEDYAFSVKFDINDFCVAKLEYHMFDGTAYVMPSINDDYPELSENWNMFAAKLTFSF